MPETTPDQVTAYLAEVRGRVEGITAGPWEHPLLFDVTHGYEHHNGRHVATWVASTDAGDDGISEDEAAANAEFIASARTAIPRLLAALEAALKLAGGWDENAPAVPYIDREAAACAVRGLSLLPCSERTEATMADCVLAFTTDGDTLWLECFADDPDAEHGQIITLVEPGTRWDDLAPKVEVHRADHRARDPEVPGA